jgi:MoaA/NifB/PqqE/SkfB family radical SAM enzyme
MHPKKTEMIEFMRQSFDGYPDRLLKYIEILLDGKNASPYCYQDTMSYRHLAISLNTYCNKNCTWCYRKDSAFKNILNKQMDFSVLEKIIKNTKGRFPKVYLTGIGEPLLYPRYTDAIREVRKITDNVVLTTNGSLLSEKKIDELTDAGLTHIEISIDCFDEEMQKKHRGTDLQHLHKMVKYISDKNILKLRINSVVNTITLPYLWNAVDYLKDCENIKTYHIIPMFDVEQMREIGVSSVPEPEMKKLLVHLESKARECGLNWGFYPSSYGINMYPSIAMKKRLNICFVCFESPTISVDGMLMPCPRQMTWGGVDATVGFEKAWNSPHLLKFRENMLAGDYPVHCEKLCYLKKRNI